MLPPNDQQLLEFALAHHRAGRLAEAEAIYRRLLAAYPREPDVVHLLGVAAHNAGRLEEARKLMQEAIAINPTQAFYFSNYGVLLYDRRDFDASAAAHETAIRLQPDFADAHYNLGNTRTAQGQFEAAATAYRRVLQLNPHHLQAHINLGRALIERGDHDAAITVYRAALVRLPGNAAVLNNLGSVLKDQGQIGEAMECFRRSLAADPSSSAVHSNLIYMAHFDPTQSAATIARELHRWWERHGAPLGGKHATHENERSPERRLRVGYVSPYWRDHVLGRNVLPLLAQHDRAQFEITIYSDVTEPDAITERFRALDVEWCDCTQLNDGQLAARIREDRIDVLVDLTLHMPGARLLVFARKPAPVQLSFAGYPGATGVMTIDGRLTDPFLEPPGATAAAGTEEAIRFGDCFWCYDPLSDEPPVDPLPALGKGRVTFGCLNTFVKVNDRALALWSRVLTGVPDAQMVVLSPPGECRERLLGRLTELGIERGRVTFVPTQKRPDFLAEHHRLDVILDTFPYNGHTTICDALWMGVPVVSLAGELPVSRAGLSILTNIGLPELVALRDDDYVRIATELARDLPRLAALRAGLRERMRSSPLMDAPRFARNIEAAYRDLWRRWCARAG